MTCSGAKSPYQTVAGPSERIGAEWISKPRWREFRLQAARLPWALAVIVFLLWPAPHASAQLTSASNRVLHLDGTNSFVELPPNIFDTLTQATIEGWVKWDSARDFQRFFDFGERDREMYLRTTASQLVFLITGLGGTRHRVGRLERGGGHLSVHE